MTGWRKRQVAAQPEQDMPKIGCVNHDCAQCKAQPVQKRPQNCGTGYCSCIECVMGPEQEPVAFINVEQRKLEWAKYMTWDTPTVVNLPKIPLYTTPPQRTWVGLTQQEVQKIHDTYHKRMGPQEFAAMVEAKLKEKNT